MPLPDRPRVVFTSQAPQTYCRSHRARRVQ
jgi:hypothetical protein